MAATASTAAEPRRRIRPSYVYASAGLLLLLAALLAFADAGENAGRLGDWQAFALGVTQGLTELLTTYRDRLHFTLDAGEVFRAARLVFVCVGTPPTYSGDADLSAVWRLVREIPKVGSPTTLVMKSTVPVGTGAKVRAELDACGLTNVGYVSNPEFLAEGTAVRDFRRPDRIVIGSFDDRDGDAVAALYSSFDSPVCRTDVASAVSSVALGAPINGTTEVAGPELFRFDASCFQTSDFRLPTS